ncbi:MAG: hypothetical protein HC828_04085 [Blastochloris sp.]|nr:hypothetical protein [Blastochloris sp.]
MTFPDSVLWNTLQEVLAADLNRAGGLAGKAVQDLAAEIESGVAVSPGPRTCVLKGLDAVVGAGLAVVVSAGVVMRFDPSSPGDDASQYLVGRLDADLSVALPAADPALPRVVLVYGTITQTSEDSTVRNVLTLPSRVVTPTAVFTSSRPTLALATVAGVAAANPALPAGPAGSIPLWYIYLPAAVTSVDPNHLIDARSRFIGWPLSRKHGREAGLYVDLSTSSLSSLTIGSGQAFVSGARLQHDQNQTFAGTAILPSGSGALTPSTEYSVYAITIGLGGLTPVGKNVVSGVVFVLSTIAPTADGRPSGAIQYRPLFGLGIDNLLVSTTDALYIGTITTDSSGVNFQIGGDGVPLNLDGTLKSLVISQLGGFPGLAPGWIRFPDLSYTSPSQVTIGLCSPIIGGVPGLFGGGVASLPGSLVAGAVETASTWYYIYLRPAVSNQGRTRGVVRHYVLVISPAAPNALGNLPAPETGFAAFEYVYIGSIYNDGASNIRPFRRVGGRTVWAGSLALYSGAIAVLPTRTAVAPTLPGTSRVAIITANALLTSSAGGATAGVLELFQDNATTDPTLVLEVRLTAAAGGAVVRNGVVLDMPTTAPPTNGGNCEYRAGCSGLVNSAGLELESYQMGYTEELSL